ncbi:MAG TPA: DUF2339 domain-containing protein [Bryobacteraceae bacterium]|nr:DUF2339 domain-containing protein [Bryobacteraceae bacterium]
MTAFLLLIVVLLAVWIWRSAARTRRNESLIAQLSSRVYGLEQELKKTRVSIPLPPPIPTGPTKPPVPPPKAEQLTPPVPEISAIPITTHIPPALPNQIPAYSSRKLLNLEETLGTNWLNKLGIVILVIGVALFLAYELSELGPLGKVVVGYAVSALMLGAGLFFERQDQWRILARTGIAGGWALLYFTSYAIYYVPAAHVLSSESLDLVLLLGLSAGIVVHTLRYDSQVVSGLAFLLAFTTLNIGHGNVYSLIAGVILAVGLVIVVLRRHWFEMELAGIAAAYLNHYLWLRPVIEPMGGHVHAFPGYFASAALLYSYWMIFRASYVLRKVGGGHGEQISTIAAVLNVALFLWLMGYQSVHPELAFQFFLMIGAVELILGQLPITRRRRAAFIVLTTLGSCLLVVAIPFHYSGQKLSAGWLAEAETLLLIGVFLREVVFRRLGLIVLIVAWIQIILAFTSVFDTEPARGTQMNHAGLAVLFGIAALMFYMNSQYIPRRWPEVVRVEPDRFSFYLLAHLAGILVGLLLWYELQPIAVVIGWALFALILMETGLKLPSPHLRGQAYVVFTASFLRLFVVNLNAAGTVGGLSARVYTIVPVTLAFYYVYARLTYTSHEILSFDVRRKVAGLHSFFGTIALTALLRFEIDADFVAAAWAVFVLLLAAVAWRTGRRIFLDQAILLAFGVLLRGVFHNLFERSYLPAPFGHGPFVSLGSAVALLFLVLPFARALRQPVGEARHSNRLLAFASALDRRPSQVFFFIPFILLTTLLAVELPSGMVTVAWGIEAFAIFALALWMKERSYRLSALSLLLLCVLKIVVRDVWGLAPRDRYLTFIVLGLALLAVSYLYTRYREIVRQYL